MLRIRGRLSAGLHTRAQEISVQIQAAQTGQEVLRLWRRHDMDAVHMVTCFWRLSSFMRDGKAVEARKYAELARSLLAHIEKSDLEARGLCNLLVAVVYARSTGYSSKILVKLATASALQLHRKIVSGNSKDLASAAWASVRLLSLWPDSRGTAYLALQQLLLGVLPLAIASLGVVPTR